MRFSANLGFLWANEPLPDAIRAAHAAGFDAVECHWPYDYSSDDVRAALNETGLTMLGLNTRRGNVEAGDMGLAALPGRESEARVAISEALDYAEAIGAEAVHVMAGIADGHHAHVTFVENLKQACARAGKSGVVILIEPLNRHDAPGYFLKSTDQARGIIAAASCPNLRLMFDCYHVGRSEGDIVTRLRELLPLIGHIQFASVPDRGTPDHGEIDFGHVFSEINAIGWRKPLGAEYRPAGRTETTLDWLRTFQK